MRGSYKCYVCGGKYQEDDVMSATCGECGNTTCIYCTDFDAILNTDLCDKCADKRMFNLGNEIDFVTKQKIKSK